MVRLAVKRRRRAASCCMVLVVKGAVGRRVRLERFTVFTR